MEILYLITASLAALWGVLAEPFIDSLTVAPLQHSLVPVFVQFAIAFVALQKHFVSLSGPNLLSANPPRMVCPSPLSVISSLKTVLSWPHPDGYAWGSDLIPFSADSFRLSTWISRQGFLMPVYIPSAKVANTTPSDADTPICGDNGPSDACMVDFDARRDEQRVADFDSTAVAVLVLFAAVVCIAFSELEKIDQAISNEFEESTLLETRSVDLSEANGLLPNISDNGDEHAPQESRRISDAQPDGSNQQEATHVSATADCTRDYGSVSPTDTPASSDTNNVADLKTSRFLKMDGTLIVTGDESMLRRFLGADQVLVELPPLISSKGPEAEMTNTGMGASTSPGTDARTVRLRVDVYVQSNPALAEPSQTLPAPSTAAPAESANRRDTAQTTDDRTSLRGDLNKNNLVDPAVPSSQAASVQASAAIGTVNVPASDESVSVPDQVESSRDNTTSEENEESFHYPGASAPGSATGTVNMPASDKSVSVLDKAERSGDNTVSDDNRAITVHDDSPSDEEEVFRYPGAIIEPSTAEVSSNTVISTEVAGVDAPLDSDEDEEQFVYTGVDYHGPAQTDELAEREVLTAAKSSAAPEEPSTSSIQPGLSGPEKQQADTLQGNTEVAPESAPGGLSSPAEELDGGSNGPHGNEDANGEHQRPDDNESQASEPPDAASPTQQASSAEATAGPSNDRRPQKKNKNKKKNQKRKHRRR